MKARTAWVRAVGAALGAGALAWIAVAGGTTGGAGAADTAAMKAVAEDGPGYAIEDFAYPNADKVLAEQGITLKRGDGHIVLADCASASDLMEVWSRAKEKVCFKVTGAKGYLALEIPAVFAVKGNNYAAKVDMTVGSDEKTFEVNKNAWTPVGESADEQGRDFMLMEIRTTK
ncbi:hypothetical protein SLAV_31840 [Streptomyces lavendulae subsp. lavendulae]|uniref:Uncharacterized protein n=2 Tax=Streptomyces lavendulae TaxID=1914 RepID=A0A2K8PPY5_STRLA|nr:hypothetical protein [Streptomyces lavendulae]ATZ28140.1 hypothetical protein SLAV_31840 [Streptomyces lavendulae subsp. lavendulae]QUQ57968.1 hypothetical protein SLLC_30010 [Streptomyces lavendulae subsp. lavendulae]